MTKYYLSPLGRRDWRNYFDSVTTRPALISPMEWYEIRDGLSYAADLAPWLDGLSRIEIPAHFTRSGVVEEWVFSPDLLEVYRDTDQTGFPRSAQEAINRVYQTAGTAD